MSSAECRIFIEQAIQPRASMVDDGLSAFDLLTVLISFIGIIVSLYMMWYFFQPPQLEQFSWFQNLIGLALALLIFIESFSLVQEGTH